MSSLENITKEQILKVKEFMEACDQEIKDSYEILSKETFLARNAWLREEADELIVAVTNSDTIEIADALSDILYISLGTLLAEGSWKNDMLLPKDKYAREFSMNRYERLIKELDKVENLSYDDYINNKEALFSSICMIITFCNSFSDIMGFELTKCFNEVHRSNMTKVMPNGKVLKNKTGKVVKPETYEEPNLMKIIFPKLLIEETITESE